MTKLYQQGDVLVFSVGSIPDEANQVSSKCGKHILAEGEVTGHMHTIPDCDAEMFSTSVGDVFLNVLHDTFVTHEEHKPITIPKGKYRIGIVKEVDPFSEEVKKVAD